MKSTLYLKNHIFYIILFGFLSIFTVASLSSTIDNPLIWKAAFPAICIPESANLLASSYLPGYFSHGLAGESYTQIINPV